jgi:hypothetical protein
MMEQMMMCTSTTENTKTSVGQIPTKISPKSTKVSFFYQFWTNFHRPLTETSVGQEVPTKIS